MVKSEMECLVDAFIEYLKSVKDYSENTVGSYKHDALLFVRFLEERGVHNITEVTEDIISEYQALLKEKKMAASTIVRYNTTIKNFFAFLVENGNIPDNPAEVIKSPSVSVSKKTPRILFQTLPRVMNIITTKEIIVPAVDTRSARFTDISSPEYKSSGYKT